MHKGIREGARSTSILISVHTTPMNATASRIMPDPTRKWVKGTPFTTVCNEYTKDGTCIGVGTIEITEHARAVGVCFASPLPKREENQLGDLFIEMFGEV